MPLTRAVIGSTLAAAWLAPALRAQSLSLDSVSRYVAAEMKRQQIPGLSVAILRGDRVLLARGYGFSNLELRVPASDSTIYQSGSLGKQFTGAAVAMLAHQRRLDLDSRIVQWFPEGRGVWDSVTVRQLLTHTSGIPEYTDSLIDLRKDYTEDELVRLAASYPLDFSPGSSWSYSNTGYLLLGVLIHRVTGRFYGDVLHQLIFSPLGMRTRVISEADIVPNRAAGYRLVKNEVKNQEWVFPSLNTTADGALYLTVNDLSKWAVALNHRAVPESRVLDAAWTPVRLKDGALYPYGFGWDLSEQRGCRRIGHTGAWQGFQTAFYRYPEFDLSVVVLANLDRAHPGAIAQAIAGMLEPALLPPQLLAAPLPGPAPPAPIPELLRRLTVGKEGRSVTPGARHFLVPAARERLRDMLQKASAWTELGCDSMTDPKIRWLGADVARICYARGRGANEHTVVSVYYTAAGQATYLDYHNY